MHKKVLDFGPGGPYNLICAVQQR